ncbi:hypothetical protein AC578_4220 [Pseudocercospora eumusae]|uniref:Uncharacterized protein n=1 Tax=Pseudocercospora eumusae TaxID=321146 RepID=A0A139H3C1_9PEZI|nr:hypothetical protein AC578_4220 [Pseudocercospora eumusae]
MDPVASYIIKSITNWRAGRPPPPPTTPPPIDGCQSVNVEIVYSRLPLAMAIFFALTTMILLVIRLPTQAYTPSQIANHFGGGCKKLVSLTANCAKSSGRAVVLRSALGYEYANNACDAIMEWVTHSWDRFIALYKPTSPTAAVAGHTLPPPLPPKTKVKKEGDWVMVRGSAGKATHKGE